MPLGPDKARCLAQRMGQPEGVLCQMQAGYRTDHLGVGRCYRHGGNTPTHERGAKVELARIACETLGIPIETDPVVALTNRLWEAEGDLCFYREQVIALGAEVTETEESGGEWGATKHVPHVLVTLYHQAQERSAKIAAECIKAGIEEKRLQLDQVRAAEVFRCVTEALKAMDLADRLEEFRHGFAAAIRSGPVSLGAS